MLYDDLEISLDVRDALLQLSSILTDETLYTSSSNTFNELISELQNMEQSFLTSSYAPDDEVLIYSSASVAVHSAIYWATAIDDDQNPYFIYLWDGVDTEPTAKFWRVVGVIAADVSGVLIGGLAGGLFGPAGAVAGATVVGTGASAAAM